MDMIPGWVEKYVGLPFEEYNCWQLICLVYRNEFKINLPTYENEYTDALDAKKIKKIYERELKIWTSIKTPQPPDLIICRVRGQPWHTGIVIAQNEMLHTQRYSNAVIERYDRFTWKNRIIGFRRHNQRIFLPPPVFRSQS